MKRGFTLIELLIVIAIIALLAGLIIVGINVIGFQVKALKTTQRIDALQSALQGLGKEAGNNAVIFQRGISGFGGTALFERVGTPGYFQPKGGAAWPVCYPAITATDPLVMAFPWGKARSYPLWAVYGPPRTFQSEAWYTGSAKFTFTLPPSSNPSDTQLAGFKAQWATVEAHDLTELRTFKAGELITLAGIASALTDFQTDRAPAQPWNDAWGYPLVVSYALFQPPQFKLTIDDYHKADYYLTEAYTAYQYNRAAYFSVAAAGWRLDAARFPSGLPSGTALTPAQLDAIWQQSCAVCMPTAATTWNQDSFDRPPWKGVKVGKLTVGGHELRSFLAAPIEVK